MSISKSNIRKIEFLKTHLSFLNTDLDKIGVEDLNLPKSLKKHLFNNSFKTVADIAKRSIEDLKIAVRWSEKWIMSLIKELAKFFPDIKLTSNGILESIFTILAIAPNEFLQRQINYSHDDSKRLRRILESNYIWTYNDLKAYGIVKFVLIDGFGSKSYEALYKIITSDQSTADCEKENIFSMVDRLQNSLTFKIKKANEYFDKNGYLKNIGKTYPITHGKICLILSNMANTNLDAKSAQILKRRYLNESRETLEKISKLYSVSKERIRQIEEKAVDKLISNFYDSKTKENIPYLEAFYSLFNEMDDFDCLYFLEYVYHNHYLEWEILSKLIDIKELPNDICKEYAREAVQLQHKSLTVDKTKEFNLSEVKRMSSEKTIDFVFEWLEDQNVSFRETNIFFNSNKLKDSQTKILRILKDNNIFTWNDLIKSYKNGLRRLYGIGYYYYKCIGILICETFNLPIQYK